MNRPQPALPTLTEVIEIVSPDERGTLPLAPESVPMESLGAPASAAAAPAAGSDAWMAGLLQRLQPRVDAWLETRGSALLAEASRTLARDLARELSAELPALARAAADELRRDAKG
jgi:hypothetical protein